MSRTRTAPKLDIVHTMERKVKKYEKYKSDILFLLISSGLWPEFHKHPRYLRVFLSIFSAFLGGATTYGIIVFCAKNITSIPILTRGLGLMISYSNFFIKVCNKHLYHNINVYYVLHRVVTDAD